MFSLYIPDCMGVVYSRASLNWKEKRTQGHLRKPIPATETSMMHKDKEKRLPVRKILKHVLHFKVFINSKSH